MVSHDYLFLYLAGYILSMILFICINYYLDDNTELSTAAGLSLLSWAVVIIQVLYITFAIFKINTDKYNEWFISSKGDK